ncbi:MAG: DUF554 domain-containing protein [Anaerolineaceae bacterium]|nr:MAG: DUF554 domain-containing protein [Anaerolineaceae bacterium]
MGGTLLNTLTVTLGASLGLLIGHRLPGRIQESIIIGLALVTIFVGLDNAAQTTNVIIPMLSLMIGVIVGEWLDIDSALKRLANWLQSRVASRTSPSDDLPVQGAMSERQRFVTGFVTASLVFCVGPLTILGSIQDGMGLPAGFEQLAIKSTLDGFAAIAFAATFGVGVLFTAFTIFFFQGSLALGGSIAGQFMTEAMIAEMVSTGGLILLGLALVILELKPVRVANFLPALVVAPLIVLILSLF